MRSWLGATTTAFVLCCACACGGDDSAQETVRDSSLPANDSAVVDHAMGTIDASLGADGHTSEGDAASANDVVTAVDLDRAAPTDRADSVERDAPPSPDVQDALGSSDSREAGGDGAADTSVTDAVASQDVAAEVLADALGDRADAVVVAHMNELDRCANDNECMTGLSCFEYGKGRPKRCTRPCTTVGASAQCPANSRCEKFAPIGNFCVSSDIGRSCSSIDECQFGCLVAQHYCTSACSTGSDCPNGYGCMAVGQQQVCVKLSADCSNDTTKCIAPSACDTTASLVLAGCTAVVTPLPIVRDARKGCPHGPATACAVVPRTSSVRSRTERQRNTRAMHLASRSMCAMTECTSIRAPLPFRTLRQ